MDTVQPNKKQYNGLPQNHNDKRLSTPLKPEGDKRTSNLPKTKKEFGSFITSDKNKGKSQCDNFWWVLISFIIFAVGAYVSKCC